MRQANRVSNKAIQEDIQGSIQIGGITPLTTIDFPNHLAAVLYCQGCSWKCSYCHNKHLIPRNIKTDITWQDTMIFLEKRKDFLDGVVLSGGEPLLQKRLPEMCRTIQQIGFKIALHTGGAIPSRLKAILPKLSWVGLDIKGSTSDYEKITGVAGSGDKAFQSLSLLLDSGIDYEVRTTADPKLLNKTDIIKLAKELSEIGVKHYALQQCRSTNSNIVTDTETIDLRPNQELERELKGLFETFEVRT